MMRRYVTADVFADRLFGGNPLAVVLDARGLSTRQMQALALEFNYSESTFVFPPENPAHTARVRLFTPRTEVPFAGHPNVGTAFLLAQQVEFAAATATGRFTFEEAAGLVPLTLLRERGATLGAELRAPEQLSRRAIVSRETTARCLSLGVDEVSVTTHAPQVASVGLPFVIAEVASRDALRRSRPNIAAYEELLPLDDADAIFAYTREPAVAGSGGETVLHARMFSPLDGIIEDPATGSAVAAAVTLLTSLDAANPGERAWRVHQGVDMGRPSLLLARTVTAGAGSPATYVGGRCVAVLKGTFTLVGEDS